MFKRKFETKGLTKHCFADSFGERFILITVMGKLGGILSYQKDEQLKCVHLCFFYAKRNVELNFINNKMHG